MSKSVLSRFGPVAAAGLLFASFETAQATSLTIAQAPPPPGPGQQQAPRQQQAPPPPGQQQAPPRQQGAPTPPAQQAPPRQQQPAQQAPQQQAPAPQGQPPQSAQPEQSPEEQQQFLEALRELLAPALDGVTAFGPDGDNPDVIRIQTSDPSLPMFYANLIEEEAAYTPEQTMEQIRGGFASCRDERPVGRRTQNEVTISAYTTVCRTEDNTELQLYVMTLHDSSSTQALMLGAPVQNGPGLIARGQRVFQGMTAGTP